MTPVQTMSREALERRLETRLPDNADSRRGYALVNVLSNDAFEAQHIPNSINIPLENLGEFEDRFAKDKEIIVYCASFDCDASPQAAGALLERGFACVIDYEGGMEDWKRAGNSIAGAHLRRH
jgi:rhodanese-related sulfurtransferase